MAPRGKGLEGLTDYMTGGPKLRKWYGAPDELPDKTEDRLPLPPVARPEDGPRDAVLVTDADSATGEQVVLQLILRGAKVRALVRDAAAAKRAYADYVTPVEGGVDSGPALARALKGTRCVVVAGRAGELPAALVNGGPEHLVLLSTAGGRGGGLLSFLGGADSALRDPQREAALQRTRLPLTVVRASRILDRPGGDQALRFEPGGGAGGEVSREDLARVAAAAAMGAVPERGLLFEVMNAGPGTPPTDWDAVFGELTAAANS